jgi:hypothetical protein
MQYSISPELSSRMQRFLKLQITCAFWIETEKSWDYFRVKKKVQKVASKTETFFLEIGYYESEDIQNILQISDLKENFGNGFWF